MSTPTHRRHHTQTQQETTAPEHRIGMMPGILVSNQDALLDMANTGAELFEAGATWLGGLDSEDRIDGGGRTSPMKWSDDLARTLPEDRSAETIGRSAMKGGEADSHFEKEHETAGKTGLRLENGSPVLGHRQAYTVPGVVTAVGDAWGSLYNGVLGGSIGLESDNEKVPIGAKVSGSVDVGLAGLEGADVRLGAKAGPASFSAGGAVERDIAPVVETEEGFEVRFSHGAGTSADVAADAGAAGFGFNLGGHTTTVGRRVFNTREEAEQFRGLHILTGIGKQELSVNQLAAMDAGESVELGTSWRAGLGAKANAQGVGSKADAGFASGETTRIEALGEGRVRASVDAHFGLDLDLGFAGPLGLGAHDKNGRGSGVTGEVDFDLNVPAAREAFEVFRDTGVVPDPAPAGVKVLQTETYRSDIDAYGADIGIGEIEHTSEVKTGQYTRDVDGRTVTGGYNDVSILDTQVARYPSGDFGGTQGHQVRIEDGPDGTRMDLESTYDGREAVSRALDEASLYDTFEGAYLKHGESTGPGPITVSRSIEPEQAARSEAIARAIAEGDNARLAELGWIKSEAQENTCDGVYRDLATDNHERAADTIGANPSCVENLAMNLNGEDETTGGSNGQQVRVQSDLVDYEAIDRLRVEIAELQQMADAGEELDDMRLFDVLTRAYGERAKLTSTQLPEHLLPMSDGGSPVVTQIIQDAETLMEGK